MGSAPQTNSPWLRCGIDPLGPIRSGLWSILLSLAVAALGLLNAEVRAQSDVDVEAFFSGTEADSERPLTSVRLESSVTIDGKRYALRDQHVAQLVERHPHLEHLILVGAPITDAGVAYLGELAELKALNLSKTRVTDEGLCHLRKFENLETLHLGDTQVGDAGMECLAGLNKLRALTLSGTSVTDKGIAALGGLNDLERLYLSDTKVQGAGFRDVVWPILELLTLGKCPVTDDSLAHLSNFKRLKSLSLNETKVTGSGLIHLENLTHLNGLGLCSLDGVDFSDPRVQKVSKRIVSLGIGPHVDADGIEELKYFSNLRILMLAETDIDDDAIASLPPLPRLHSVILSDTQVTERGLRALHVLMSLKSVYLVNCPVTVDGLSALEASMPRVRFLPSAEELRLMNTFPPFRERSR